MVCVFNMINDAIEASKRAAEHSNDLSGSIDVTAEESSFAELEADIVDSTNDKSEEAEIVAILQQMESLRGNVQFSEGKDVQEDLSKYYFSDEEEESSSEQYTEWDAVEYSTGGAPIKIVNSANKENAGHESGAIARELERIRREQRRAYEHDQFDLESVKAMWLDGIDRNQKLPGFTLLLTSNEDPYFMRRLCYA